MAKLQHDLDVADTVPAAIHKCGQPLQVRVSARHRQGSTVHIAEVVLRFDNEQLSGRGHSDVQVRSRQRIALDEIATRLYFLAHEHGEEPRRSHCI